MIMSKEELLEENKQLKQENQILVEENERLIDILRYIGYIPSSETKS